MKKVSFSTPLPRSRDILKGVSLTVEKGTNTVIFGDNGSGKTTLLKLLLELVVPSSGTVRGGSEKASAFFEDVESQLFFTRVVEEIASSGKDNSMKELCMELLDLKKLEERSIMELSYSQKARLGLACAYMSGRDFILIDSPPRDERIDRAVEYFASRGEPTHLLFLPEGEKRAGIEKWRRLKLTDGRIKEYAGQ